MTDSSTPPQQAQSHAEELERILAKIRLQDQQVKSLRIELASLEHARRNLDRQLLFVLTQTNFQDSES